MASWRLKASSAARLAAHGEQRGSKIGDGTAARQRSRTDGGIWGRRRGMAMQRRSRRPTAAWRQPAGRHPEDGERPIRDPEDGAAVFEAEDAGCDYFGGRTDLPAPLQYNKPLAMRRCGLRRVSAPSYRSGRSAAKNVPFVCLDFHFF
jgi:hypothetical protein